MLQRTSRGGKLDIKHAVINNLFKNNTECFIITKVVIDDKNMQKIQILYKIKQYVLYFV